MNRMSRMTAVFMLVFALIVSVQGVQAEEGASPSNASDDNSVKEDSGQVEPGPEEGKEGEVTERGVPRITIPGIGGTQKPRPKIIPSEKFRLQPKPKIKIPEVQRVPDTPLPGRPPKPEVGGGGQGQPPSGRFVPNQVIVKLRPGMFLPQSTVQTFGLKPLRTTSGGHVLFRFSPPPALKQLDPLGIAEQLAKQAAVLFAQPNRIYVPERIPRDELFPHQWHFLENGNGLGESPGGIGLPKVWDRTIGNRNVVVAVIDTGISVKDSNTGQDHPDIIGTGNLLPGFDFISDLKRAADGNGRDPDPTDPGDGTDFGVCTPGVKGNKDTWHGNNVAGVIGMGRTNGTEGIAGINWLVGLLPVRVSGKCGADDFDLYDAIKWSAGLPVPEAPLNPNPARIINVSLGSLGICDRLIQEAIDEVVTKMGASVVVAAGNKTTLAAFQAPANCKNVITVAASNEQGHLAPYSNFGSAVTIMAPGGNRKVDVDKDGMPDGVLTLNHPTLRFPETAPVPPGYSLEMGTSLAAPHVSGVLALWLAVDSTLTHAELVQGLQDNAFARNTTQCPNSCGAGLLNADLSSIIQPGKPDQPPPGKDKPPPPKDQPPPVAQCKIKTSEIVQSLKVDIGSNDSQTTSAKQSLFRMLSQGDFETRREASSMFKSTENGALAGIFQRNKGPVAARGQRMIPPKGWWELIPQGQPGLCLKEPGGEPPMIIYREQEMSPPVLDDMLRNAWRQCGLPNLEFPCQYIKDMENKETSSLSPSPMGGGSTQSPHPGIPTQPSGPMGGMPVQNQPSMTGPAQPCPSMVGTDQPQAPKGVFPPQSSPCP